MPWKERLPSLKRHLEPLSVNDKVSPLQNHTMIPFSIVHDTREPLAVNRSWLDAPRESHTRYRITLSPLQASDNLSPLQASVNDTLSPLTL